MPRGHGDGQPGADHRPLAGREHDPVRGGQIEAGVAVVGPARQHRVRADLPHGELRHGMRAASPGSATR
jgi:hypothetical protein